MATRKDRSDAYIEDVIAGVDAGHRMAGHDPTQETRETSRRILREVISADDAVAEAIARHQAASPRD